MIALEMTKETAEVVLKAVEEKMDRYVRAYENAGREFSLETAPDWFIELVNAQLDIQDLLDDLEIRDGE